MCGAVLATVYSVLCAVCCVLCVRTRTRTTVPQAIRIGEIGVCVCVCVGVLASDVLGRMGVVCPMPCAGVEAWLRAE